MIKNFKTKLRKYFKELIEIKSTPNEIALGFAVGTAIAVLPTFGLGIFIGLAIVFLFKKVSKLSMLVSFAFWNPLVLIPTTALSYYLGNLLFSGGPILNLKFSILNVIYLYTRRFLLGNLIVTTVLTLISYFLVLFLAKKYKKKEIPILQKPLEIEIGPISG